MLSAVSIAQSPIEVQLPYSTHDWTQSVGGEGGTFNEAWADVKAPGDGRQYAVGTIEVRFTGAGALFSGQPAERADLSLPIVNLSAPNRRQVVMLQITDTNQSIVSQRFYYGITLEENRATNARGISVWAATNPEDARIAICGETYDRQLPLAQASFPAATTSAPTGFIAVFNGDGDLLWSHHVFGTDPTQSCAITDVSIRVDAEGRDVVTYCGISSHGVPAATTPLSPVAWYPAGADSGGNTDQGAGQWDGIVGRVLSTSAMGLPESHSIVGGPQQDGLFGIAELEANRYVVVGGTRWSGSGAPTPGLGFPGLGAVGAAFNLGVALVFDEGAGGWVHESTLPLGSVGGEIPTTTLARDVVVLRDGFATTDSNGFAAAALHSVAIVGSTDDAALFASFLNPVAPPIQGATDGFVALALDIPNSFTASVGRFHGGTGNDGLTGVQTWNEYPDYVVACGFTEGLGIDSFGVPGALDISVESFFIKTDPVNPTVPNMPPGAPVEMRSLRRAQIGGSGQDRPAAMGVVHATTTGLLFDTGPLNEPAGGGITVDERARVNVVGQTLSSNYPAVAGRPFDAGRDAVRSVFDLVPPGVGRTDLTGSQAGFTPVAGFTGGTTPACALSAFGKRIGEPAPAVSRMLIEYEGPPPAAGVTGGAVIVVRPTAPILPGTLASGGVFAAFQFDFPGVPAPPTQLYPGAEGAEIWVIAAIAPGVFGYPNQSFVIQLFQMPTPPVVGQPMTVQVACWVPSLVPGGVTSPCTTTSFLTTTPAMWLPL